MPDKKPAPEATKPENVTKMPAKDKPKAPKKDPVAEAVAKTEAKKNAPAVDPMLLDSIGAVKALKLIEQLLTVGLFPGELNKSLGKSIAFIQSMHGDMVKRVKKHPQAGLLNFLDGGTPQ